MSEIKSKKAQEYIERHTIQTDEYGDIILSMSVDRAVIVAEQEARHRARKAYCRMSNTCVVTKEFRPCVGKCQEIIELLKLYDNED